MVFSFLEKDNFQADSQDPSSGLPLMLLFHMEKQVALTFLPASVADCQNSSWRPGASEHTDLELDWLQPAWRGGSHKSFKALTSFSIFKSFAKGSSFSLGNLATGIWNLFKDVHSWKDSGPNLILTQAQLEFWLNQGPKP